MREVPTMERYGNIAERMQLTPDNPKKPAMISCRQDRPKGANPG